jgi:putative SOS response-associated peptidase YedK
LFVFAGPWEGETCTILTTAANDLMRPLHERMPVIIGREAEADWLLDVKFATYPALADGGIPGRDVGQQPHA